MYWVRIAALFMPALCWHTLALSQITYRGKVTDKENHHPMEGVSVFFSNTSYGTTTDAGGNYTLRVPAGRYDMVVAMVGYETFVKNMLPADSGTVQQIELTVSVKELDAVVLEAYEKNGWEKWGSFFFENFIGTSDYASECHILNYKDIRFRISKHDNELTAVCRKPLVIENKGLGYTIRYQLERFTFSYKTHMLLYSGYALFEEMKGSERQQREWARRREEVFSGSMLHFMRAFYQNRLQENNFVLHQLTVVPDQEKNRVRNLYRMLALKAEDASPDSSSYYGKILAGPDNREYLDMNAMPYDSIGFTVNNTTKGFIFNDHLLVVYNGKQEPYAYMTQVTHNKKPVAAVSSKIVLQIPEAIQVTANGAYFDPVNMASSGYWAWAEKIAYMLPVDYVSAVMK